VFASANLVSRISTCRSYPNCKDRPRRIRRRRDAASELCRPRAHSNCLQTRKTVVLPQGGPLPDGFSLAGAPRDLNHSDLTIRDPSDDAVRRADLHNAGSGTRTDQADRIHPTVARVLRQRDGAGTGCQSRPDMNCYYSESPPHGTARRFFLARAFSRTVA